MVCCKVGGVVCTIILIIVVSNDNYAAAPSSQLSSAMMRSRKPPVCLNFWPRAAETDTNLPRKRRQETLPRPGAALGMANTRFLTPMDSNCHLCDTGFAAPDRTTTSPPSRGSVPSLPEKLCCGCGDVVV